MGQGDRRQHLNKIAEAWLIPKSQCNRPSQNKTWEFIVPRYVPENSVVVMGGHFQSQMVHATISHTMIMNPGLWASHNSGNALTWPKAPGMQALAQGEVDKCMKSTKQAKAVDVTTTRKVWTYRFVKKHKPACPRASAWRARSRAGSRIPHGTDIAEASWRRSCRGTHRGWRPGTRW